MDPIPFLSPDTPILVLLVLTVVLAVASVEFRNLMHAVLFLLLFNISLGVLYYIVGAPMVALFQLAVFAGAVIVFFILTVMLTRGGESRG